MNSLDVDRIAFAQKGPGHYLRLLRKGARGSSARSATAIYQPRLAVLRDIWDLGWSSMSVGNPDADQLEDSIVRYFAKTDIRDGFERCDSMNGNAVDIRALNKQNGFFLVNLQRQDIDFAPIMYQRSREYGELITPQSLKITRQLIDYDDKVAGFSWRVTN